MTTEQAEKGSTKKIRFKVTVPPHESLPLPSGDSDRATAGTTVLVEGSVLHRPLTEPVAGARPGGHHTYFVYADTREEAEHKVRQATNLGTERSLTVEEAGHVDEGGIHIPPEDSETIQRLIRNRNRETVSAMQAVAEVVPLKGDDEIPAITSVKLTATYNRAEKKVTVQVKASGNTPHDGIELEEIEPSTKDYQDGHVLCIGLTFRERPNATALHWESKEEPFRGAADCVVLLAPDKHVLTAKAVEKV